jgi:hypothetical protein
MRPGIGENQNLRGPLKLSAEHTAAFPTGRPVPWNGSSGLDLGAPRFIARRASAKAQDEQAACRESDSTHELAYSLTDW